MQRLQHQLHADKGQHRGQAVGEIDQPVEQATEQEVQLTQTEQRKRGGHEDDVDIAGEPEQRGNRVEGEQQVGSADDDHHQQHWRHYPFAILDGEQPVAVESVGGAQRTLGEADNRRVGAVPVGVRRPDEVPRGDQQSKTEQVEGRVEDRDERGTDEDEDAASHQREHDSEQQHLLLRNTGNRETRDDDQEDEKVVNRQRLVEQVAGEVLHARADAGRDRDADPEQHCGADVDRRPDSGVAQCRLLNPANVKKVVEQRQADDQGHREQPHRCGNTHLSCASFHRAGRIILARRSTHASHRARRDLASIPHRLGIHFRNLCDMTSQLPLAVAKLFQPGRSGQSGVGEAG